MVLPGRPLERTAFLAGGRFEDRASGHPHPVAGMGNPQNDPERKREGAPFLIYLLFLVLFVGAMVGVATLLG